jgi:hypothetical protein
LFSDGRNRKNKSEIIGGAVHDTLEVESREMDLRESNGKLFFVDVPPGYNGATC